MSKKTADAWVRGQSLRDDPSKLCAFEIEADRLGLKTEQDMLASEPLRKWCSEHANQRFIPERLLSAWKIKVLDDVKLRSYSISRADVVNYFAEKEPVT